MIHPSVFVALGCEGRASFWPVKSTATWCIPEKWADKTINIYLYIQTSYDCYAIDNCYLVGVLCSSTIACIRIIIWLPTVSNQSLTEQLLYHLI